MTGKSNAEINERLAASGPATRSKKVWEQKWSFGGNLGAVDGGWCLPEEGETGGEEADERSTRPDRESRARSRSMLEREEGEIVKGVGRCEMGGRGKRE
jgi:hypothetical protein